MPSILVTGLLPLSRGKTSLVLLLAQALSELGVPVAFSKPAAIGDYTNDYELLPGWLESGTLYPREWLLAREAGFKLRLEEFNPLFILLAPLNLGLFFKEGVPSAIVTYEEDLARRTLLARFYSASSGEHAIEVLVNKWAQSRGVLLVDKRLVERAVSSSERVFEVDRPEALRGLLVDALRRASELALENLKRRSVVQVLEGVSDWVFTNVRCDLVVAVHQSQAVFFDGSKIARALEVTARGAVYERVRALLGLVSPLEVMRFTPALPGESLEGAVKRNTDIVHRVVDYLLREKAEK